MHETSSPNSITISDEKFIESIGFSAKLWKRAGDKSGNVQDSKLGTELLALLKSAKTITISADVSESGQTETESA